MTLLHFVGVDAGNSSAKVVTQLEGCDMPLLATAPNVSAFAEELDVPPVSPDPLERLDLEIMDSLEGYDGERFVGTLATRQLAQDVVQDRSRDKADSDNINLITPALLGALCEPGDKVVLGIGSPFTDFQSQRSRIIERLKRPFKVRFGKYSTRPGQVVSFEVVEVYPYPQTAAGYIAQAARIGSSHPEWAESSMVVFDLGLGQTGAAYISSGEAIKAGCFSVDEPAFLRVAQGVQRYLNTEHQRDLTIPEVLDVIEVGRYQIGVDLIDLTSVVAMECEQLVKALKRRFDELVPVKLRDQASSLLLIGGGALAPFIANAFKDEFKRPAIVGHEPRFANATGLMEQAKAKYQKELSIHAAR